MKTPELILEQLFLKEKEYTETPGLDDAMKAIARSNEEILQAYPGADMKAAIRAKLTEKGEKTGTSAEKGIPFTRSGRKLPYFRFMAYAAAASCVLFISVSTMRRSGYIAAIPEMTELTERVKGGSEPRLLVYRKSMDGTAKDGAVLLVGESTVQADDIVQVSYIAAGDTFGSIISVDGNGVVTQHFPDSGDMTGLLSQKGEVSLDFSYRLDSAPEFERFIFISGTEQASIAQYKKEISRAALRNKTGSFEINGALPANTHATDILLRK